MPGGIDTIAAIATPPGSGGVGTIRVSGPRALDVGLRVFKPGKQAAAVIPRFMHFGHIVDGQGRRLDEVLFVYFPGPHSFTGEDVVEIHGHGGVAVLHAVLEEVLLNGARQAGPGEFTKRAFLSGRMDLTQAEAVAELIAAPGKEGIHLASAKLEGLLGRKITELREKLEYVRQRICVAIDFPEEEAETLPQAEFAALVTQVMQEVQKLLAAYERNRFWREGASVVLTGRVNTGKSSLMNALLGRPRAIVTDKPGTTRDYLEEFTNLCGVPVRLVDTAGLRDDSRDPIEREGIRLSREIAAKARAILLVVDGAELGRHLAGRPGRNVEAKIAACLDLEKNLVEELGPQRMIMVWNKADLCDLPDGLTAWLGLPVVPVSARTGHNLDALAALVRKICQVGEAGPDDLAPNLRQSRALMQARQELAGLLEEIRQSTPPDLCSLRLDAAGACLADITGLNSVEETLNKIFADFCIGK